VNLVQIMSHSDSGSSGGERRPSQSSSRDSSHDEACEETVQDADLGPEVDQREDFINVDSLDLLELESYQVDAVQEALRLLVSQVPSQEALGEAVYNAIFEAAPSLQNLFHTPKAVQAMRFVSSLVAFVSALGNPEKLKMLAESLAFGHLATDVTVPRCAIFRDALVELMSVELEDKFTSEAHSALKMLLNYMGGAMIFVKAHYSERLKLLVKSWKNANPNHRMEASTEEAHDNAEDADAGSNAEADVKEEAAGGDTLLNAMQMASQKVPKDFPEMFYFNATVMGFAQRTWFKEVLPVFQNIVLNVANSTRLQEECEVLVLRIVRVATAQEIDFSEFESCMLASLRSLLPQEWSAEHEVAWTWLWENVQRILAQHLVSAPLWHRALKKFLSKLSEESRFELRNGVYARFFEVAPSGQLFFKQSNTYLHFIADRIIGMTLDMYEDPAKMVDDISALGLRHVGYGIQTELLGPFVSSFCDVVATAETGGDSMVAPSMRWSIGLIGKILTRTINEGSTIVMKAINANVSDTVVHALSLAPRGERFKWSLVIKVGTQAISPLSWSIESGSFAATKALLEDLLTIRADRDRYYYGADDLFGRHPDIIQRLCSEAPALLWTLFDGLVWRARMVTDGQRRVNYFIKHLVVALDGNPSQAIEWICTYQDPRLVCHPLIETTSNILWLNVVYHLFLRGRAWFILTMCIFMTNAIDASGTQEDEVLLTFIFCCRMFIYAFALPHLLLVHTRKVCRAFRSKTLKRCFILRVPEYWAGRQGSCGVALTLALCLMLAHEPMLWCLSSHSKHGFTADCDDAEVVSVPYRMFSSVAMLLYFALALDLAVCANRLLVFLLLCGQMVPELLLFLMALAWTTALVACIVSALDTNVEAFDGMDVSGLSLLKITMGIFPSYDFEHLEVNAAVSFLALAFSAFGLLFLGNVLVAQLTCSYQAVWKDMVGYARLSRMRIIAELLPRVKAKAWQRFVQSQGYHNRLEFNTGDVGLAGGVQVLEPAHNHPTLSDAIHRYGGSTSPSKPWPGDEGDANSIEKQFEGLENALKKTLKKLGHAKGSKGSSGSSMFCSSSGSMSQSMGDFNRVDSEM